MTKQEEQFPTLASVSESAQNEKEKIRHQLTVSGLPRMKKPSRSLKNLKASTQAQKKKTAAKKKAEQPPKPKIEVTENPTKSSAYADYNVIFKPNKGPQTNFLAASEREVLYGGAAGGGKSYAMLADPLRYLVHPQFSGLLLRKTTEELR